MTKAWCIWCENGERQSTSGYSWIHQKCAMKMMDISSDIKSIKEILNEIHPRSKKDKNKLNVVYKYVKDMEDFKRKWEGTNKIYREMGLLKDVKQPENE